MPPANPRKPADVSATNKEKNEYIPSFISKKPFYVDDAVEESSDYLEHQRLQKSAAEYKWYDRGRKLGPAATKFRKGACENCGAMTHKAKDCLERPRKQGAKWTGKDIQADEVIQDVKLGWEAKRDRWNGYDPSEYMAVVDEYNQLEEMKKLSKGAIAGDSKTGETGEANSGDEGAKYEEETDMGRKQSTATRNLRLREDTAKYLVNLDLDSAKYDPKTRSMVDSGATLDEAAELVAEEGFMRASGDAAEFERAQKYAWESQEKGGKNRLHLQANPTSGEIMRKKETQEAEAKKAAHRKALLAKYGGQEYIQDSPLKDAAVVESERYVEYDEHGGIKGAPKIKVKSKYAEDVFINNHTTVWGSWWSDFKWGYACCHSFVKNSYCTGEEGKRAVDTANRLRLAADLGEPSEDNSKENGHIESTPTQSTTLASIASKKRPLQDMAGGISDSEMDDYRRKRQQSNDPMASLLGKDEILD